MAIDDSDFESLEVEVADRVATLTINRPMAVKAFVEKRKPDFRTKS